MIEFGGVVFEVPVGATRSAGTPIEGDFGEWRGRDLIVRVDASPFADPLTGYSDRPEHRISEDPIDGHPARAVTFRDHDGNHVAAVHIPDAARGRSGRPRPVTVYVNAGGTAAEATARRVAASVRVAA